MTVELRELLKFYAEAGVDEAIEEVAIDRFAEFATQAAKTGVAGPQASQAPAAGDVVTQAVRADGPARVPQAQEPRPAQPARPQQPTAAVPDEGQVLLARELAARARTLDELRDAMGAFEGCNLRYTAKSLVFSDGNPEGPLMLVGEAPGRDEDIEGKPFVGRSGQLLDRMLAAIGMDRTSAYIANVIPWRPPGNRTPTPQETEICRAFIERQIELADPKVLVSLGGPSAKVVIGTPEGIMKLRGNWRVHRTASGKEIPVMPTLHPAYLLRNPAHKRLAWRDFLEVKAKLRALG
ncbi:uracil-DNA glycosylase [Mesorhizobium sp. BAC0120]|uniref:uracil-DNA glycosylase n=1 Tax=Mesorhizobium sp. BAC0120 TaxID=3090670 RepID=UPI00298CFAED|nr:uracil-DNA glycosylase [Mesorhizobium sp. BAC0120]MDW6021151.1 uracil-DNA glycosylase [Mesorhizobium sp. BAC0120]